MSKKKASLTMTLKDFHGGSIPSLLPLPSAPGSNGSARPPDRPGAWGSASPGVGGRSDILHHHLLRPRPGSAGATSASARGLDDRPPAFLPNPPNIGRHFDEDERKPFDASSAPRRSTAPEDSPRSPQPARSESKRPISNPVVPPPVIAPAPIAAFPPPSCNVGFGASAWGPRKDAGSELPPSLPIQPTAMVWSASRLAQASAIEKVSSGRWQSRAPEMEVIRSHENQVVGRGFGERSRVVDDIHKDREKETPKSVLYEVAFAEVKEKTVPGAYKESFQDQERARSPIYNEKNAAGFPNEGARPASTEGRFIGSKIYQQGTVEVSERPKIKLLPRGKPLESPDTQTRDFDDKQAYLASLNLVQVHNNHEMHGSTNPKKPGSAGSDDGSRTIERPKLNLKPRKHPMEQSDGNTDKARQTVFGGARPRELVNFSFNTSGPPRNPPNNGSLFLVLEARLGTHAVLASLQVLKERGIDVAANDLDMPAPPTRARNDILKTDSKTEPNGIFQSGERIDRLSVGQKTGKDIEKKGYRPDTDRGSLQNSSWKNDNRNNRENGKLPEQPRADTDNWRKPIVQPKPNTPAPRFGKAASALELAQAFSRSVSDTKLENRFTSQRSVPGQIQLPFSRLTDSRELYAGPAHRQINGY